MSQGKGFGGALKGFAKGAGGGILKGLAGKALGKLTGGGKGEQFSGGNEFGQGFADVGGQGGGGIGGFLQNLFGGGNALKNLGGLALGGLSVKESADRRKSSEAFNQQLLEIQKAQLGKAEAEFDRKAPLRNRGQAALISAIEQQELAEDPFSKFLRTSHARGPGEFSQRSGVAAPAPSISEIPEKDRVKKKKKVA